MTVQNFVSYSVKKHTPQRGDQPKLRVNMRFSKSYESVIPEQITRNEGKTEGFYLV